MTQRSTSVAGVGPVVVTGAAGFIGSHVSEALLSRGRRVIGVDNFDPFYHAAVKRANVARVLSSAHHTAFELVETDIRDSGTMAAVFDRSGAEGVVHLAARAGVRPSIADPVGYADVNVRGTASVLDAAGRAGCSRVVIASSSSVYGNNEKTPFSEGDDVNAPISPYAATKRACELIAHTHHTLTGMPTACLRFFTVFGPGQRPDLAISSFMRKIARNEEVTLFGDGSTSRDYTYIEDIVTGVLAAYERIPRHGYRVWNLGGNEPITLSEMVETVASVVGRAPLIRRAPMQPGDVHRTWADLGRSAAELDYRVTTRFVDGVRRQWEWQRATGLE